MGAQVSSAPQVRDAQASLFYANAAPGLHGASSTGRLPASAASYTPAGGLSTSASAPTLSHISDQNREIITMLMPLYYTKAAMLPDELVEACRVWNIICRNQSRHFAELKVNNPGLQPKIVSEYLHLVFYNRLFEVHPSCRGMFGRALNKMNLLPMISLMLSKLDDEPALRKTLGNLVNVHNKIGVKAVEYGIVGEVLMFAIKAAVGQDEYTPAAHTGWCKIYSVALDIIVPEVVRFELENRETAAQIVEKRMSRTSNAASTASLATANMLNGNLAYHDPGTDPSAPDRTPINAAAPSPNPAASVPADPADI